MFQRNPRRSVFADRPWAVRALVSLLVLVAGSIAFPCMVAGGEGESATLVGAVRSEGGEPVEGARVLAAGEPNEGSWAQAVEAVTSEDGTFELKPGGKAPFAVRVVAPGYADLAREAIDGDEPLELRLSAERVGRGSVHDEETGKPIAGARVWPAEEALGGNLAPDARKRLLPSATTDDGGRFTLGRLPAGSVELRIEARGYAARTVEARSVPPDADAATDPLHAYLSPGVVIAGVLRDADGNPLPGVRVRVRPDRLLATVGNLATWADRGATAARTLADGSFEIPGAPAAPAYLLTATKRGFADRRWTDLRPGPGGSIEELDLQLTRGGGVRAELVDADGNPLRVEVSANARYTDAGAQSGRMPFSVTRDGDRDAQRPGMVTVEQLPPGEASITFQPRGYDEVSVDGVAVREGEIRDLGQLLVEEGLGIAGRVLDAEGQPMAGARIRARGFSGAGFDHETTETAEDGRFRLGGLVEGTQYDLTVLAEGFGPAQREEVEPGSEPLEFRLQPAASLRGRVVSTADGEPVPRYRIRVSPDAEGGGGLDPQSLMRRLTTERQEVSSPEGIFALDGLAAGGYRVHFEADGFVPRVVEGVELRAGEQADLEVVQLDPGLVVRGAVTDAETGRPVPAASVATAAAGPMAIARRQIEGGGELAVTAPDGTFEASGLAPGRTTLVFDHPRYAKSRHEIELTPASPAPPLSIAMSPGGAIEGVVLGDDGRPLAGARVMAMSGFTPEPGQQTTTDELGHYRLEHLEPGTVRVLVMKMDVSDGPPEMSSLMQGMKMETAEVEDGKTTMLNFPTSEGSIHVTGRLLHADERPLKAVMMWFPDEGGRIGGGSLASSVSGDDGAFSVRLPEPGLYRVVAQSLATDPRQRESFLLEAAVEHGPEVQLELTIPDTEVSGAVTDVATGAPLEGVQVRARPRDGQPPAGGTTTTRASGRYRLEGLTPGEYDLVFRQPGYGMAVLEELDLDQGDALSDRDVTLAGAVPVPLGVVDDRGRPVGGAWAMTAAAEGTGGQELGLAGEDGRMTIDVLPPGDHEICVWAPGYAPHVTTVSVPPLDRGAFRAELSPGAPVEIRVVGASGEPLADAAVEIRTEDGADLTRTLRLALASRGGGGVTGADGTLEIPGLEPGDYRITVSLGELEATEKVTVTANEDNEVEIDLR